MVHKDTLGNEDSISDGEVQWMNSGSGILHEEQVPASPRILGVQLWLNLPQKEKMSHPTYRHIGNDDIEEISIEGGFIRLLAGEYKGRKAHQATICLSITTTSIWKPVLNSSSKRRADDSVMAFTLLGDASLPVSP